MGNLDIYEKVKVVPETAKKTIGGGKLKGMTDINPMWRIKVLTEQFGACGFGWYYETTNQWKEEGANEIACFVNINLYIKVDGEWSKPIFGTGGAKMIALEKGNPVLSDECYKMATTDAISVACKQLGIGADVYWDKDRTKYSTQEEQKATDFGSGKQMTQEEVANRYKSLISKEDYLRLKEILGENGISEETICKTYNVKSVWDLTYKKYDNVISHIEDLVRLQKASEVTNK